MSDSEDQNKLSAEQARTVKGLYISALVFAGIALVGKLVYLATGKKDTMASLRKRLVAAAGGLGGGEGSVVDRVMSVALDGPIVIAVVLLAVAVAIQNHVLSN